MFEFLKKIFSPHTLMAAEWLKKTATTVYSTDIEDFFKAVNPKDIIKLKKKFTLSRDPWKAEYQKIIKISSESNLDLNVKDEKGNTFLHYLGGKFFICPLSDYLLQKGAEANTLNNDGEPPLKYVVKNSKYGSGLQVTSCLAQATSKENLNKVYSDGETILTNLIKNICAQKSDVENIIKAGADVNMLNAQGQSPLGCIIEMFLNSENYKTNFMIPNILLPKLNNHKTLWMHEFNNILPKIAYMLIQQGAHLTHTESQKIIHTAEKLEANISKEDRHDGEFYFKCNHQRSGVIFGLAGLPQDYPLSADKAGQQLINRAKKGNIIETVELFTQSSFMKPIVEQVRERILKETPEEKPSVKQVSITVSKGSQPITSLKHFKQDNQKQNQ